MANEDDDSEIRALTEESRAILNAKATFWDERMGEGNTFQRAPGRLLPRGLRAGRPGRTFLHRADVVHPRPQLGTAPRDAAGPRGTPACRGTLTMNRSLSLP